jgi:hypothetical protein
MTTRALNSLWTELPNCELRAMEVETFQMDSAPLYLEGRDFMTCGERR